MPFQTDSTWTPSAYRRALEVYRATEPPADGQIFPRRARTTRARHTDIENAFPGLLTWRTLCAGSDWPTAANDNFVDEGEQDERVIPPSLDSYNAIFPSVPALMRAVKDVAFMDRATGKPVEVGTPTPEGESPPKQIVPFAGDFERRPCGAMRIGKLLFSNGIQEELILTRKETIGWRKEKIRRGGLVSVAGWQVEDEFRVKPANRNWPTAETTAPADPVADEDEARHIRAAVGPNVAGILDHAISAASFKDVGERLGHRGKTAERRGKLVIIEACKILQEKLAA